MNVKSNIIDKINILEYKSMKSLNYDKLWELKDYLINNNSEYINVIKHIRELPYGSDEYKNEKQNLPYIMVGCICKGNKSADNIIWKNYIISIDIDYQDNKELLSTNNEFDICKLNKLKERLFNISWVYSASLSCGGKGIYLIIPIAHPEKFKQHFNAIAMTFKKNNIIIDKQCGNINRLRFVSFDNNILIKENTNVEVFEKVYEEINKPFIHYKFNNTNSNTLCDDDKFCYYAIKHIINNNLITYISGNGGTYNKWFADAIRMSSLGNIGLELFTELTSSTGYKTNNCISKFKDAVKYNADKGRSMAYYFSLLKKRYGSNWINIIKSEIKTSIIK